MTSHFPRIVRGSVRTRLALWYTSVFGVVLIAFAAIAYGLFKQTTEQRTDRYLEEAAAGLGAGFEDELTTARTIDAAAAEAVHEFRGRDLTVAIYDSTNRLVAASSDTASSRDTPAVDLDQLGKVRPGPNDLAGGWRTVHGHRGRSRIYAMTIRISGHLHTIVVGQSLHAQMELLEDIREACMIAIPLALLLAAIGGHFLAGRSLRPTLTMAAQATRMSATNLSERLVVINPKDELGQLAQVFNGLLSRLEQAFEQQRRFMADASHELRTPVAIIRTEADVALARSERSPENYREALEIIRNGGRRLSTIVDDLMLLARADAGQQPLRYVEFYLDELVVECVRGVRTLAARRNIDVSIESQIEAPCHGDDELLRRLILNLLDNAIKYSPPGASVLVGLTRSASKYQLTVTDTGNGIPEEAQSHVFDRFYRADQARARTSGSEVGGAGLGLAIARWIAEAHGGQLRLVRSSETGSEFTAEIPAAA